jgi:NAD(P)-dependent dehydrogenase (short-subunit alcohol dehydrogenase family)
MRQKRLRDQVVIVMGASSGIGRETALQLARAGARVVVSARDEEGLRTLVTEILSRAGYAFAVPADATQFESVKAVADAAVERYGRLDTWVHTAAVSLYASLDETTPEEYRQIIDTNLNGVAYAAMAALPYLKREGRGAFIAVSSVEGKQAFPLHAAYAASKHGVVGLMDSLRMDLRLAGSDVSVTTILPSSVDTPSYAQARTKLGVQPRAIPPVYHPASVARAILYAAEHPTREIVVGGAGKALLMARSIMPSLVDRGVTRLGASMLHGQEPKSAYAPDNLFEPHTGIAEESEKMRKKSARRSVYTWITTQSIAKIALAGIVLSGLGVAVSSAVRKTPPPPPPLWKRILGIIIPLQILRKARHRAAMIKIPQTIFGLTALYKGVTTALGVRGHRTQRRGLMGMFSH